MIVVSDAAPIISLAKINLVYVLGKLYGKVILPKAVFDEICANQAFSDEAKAVQDCDFIKVSNIDDMQAVKALREAGLDLGESEAIVLAEMLPDSLLLMDERKGRKIALNMGLRITGTLGILIQTKNLGLVKQVKPLMDTLINTNIRISESLYYSILERVDEQ